MPYRRKGSPFWWVKYTDASGKPVYRSTKTTELKEAKALEAKWRHEAHQLRMWGIQPEHSFMDMMEAFVAAKQDQWKSSERFTMALKKLFPHFGLMMAEQIRRADVAEYIRKRKADGVSGSTINRELDVLSAACQYVGNILEWKVNNPTVGMSLKEPEGRLRWLTEEEAGRLIREASKEGRKSPHLADFIRLALYSGCRKGELLGLTWERVDFNLGHIRFEGENTKNSKRRIVPMNKVVRSVLESRLKFRNEHCSTSPWVFAHENGERVKYMQGGFRAACQRAGISDFRVHDLRHTCASWLVSSGVPLFDVSKLLGHSSTEMTERYAHLAPGNLAKVAKALDKIQTSDNSVNFD